MPRRNKPWYRASRDRWYTEIAGRQIVLARGKENRDEAERRFHELMAERLANPPVDGGNPTVASVLDAFLVFDHGRSDGKAFENRLFYLQRFAEAHGRRLVRDCIAHHLRTWVDAQPTWRSQSTRYNAVRHVKRAFNWAVAEGLIPANPFLHVNEPAGEGRRPLSDEEFAALVCAVGPVRDRPTRSRWSRVLFLEVLFFLRFTGARPSEARRVRWSEVDLDRGVIVMHHHKSARTRKVPKPRVIMLGDVAVRLLTKIRRRSEGDGHVFVTYAGTPWADKSLSQKLGDIRDEAGIAKDVTLYTIRHRFATEACKNGVALKDLAELMGHTTTRMTEHYVDFGGELDHLHQAVRRATGEGVSE